MHSLAGIHNMTKLEFSSDHLSGPLKVEVPLSKSVANRWLILEALFPEFIEKNDLSEARDTRILREALLSTDEKIDIQDAGTAMRFATAYFSVQYKRRTYLHGTDRMHERPIAPLVNALRDLGGEIRYEKTKGYPPLSIYGKHLRGGEVYIPADMSSQFISALMLIAPATNDGVLINRTSRSVSQPYVDMTAAVLRQAGVEVNDEGTRIHVHGKPTKRIVVPTEGDWSAAAAFFAWVAVSGQTIHVAGLSADSVQGDVVLLDWATELGLKCEWVNEMLEVSRVSIPEDDFNLDFLDHPDLAQSLVMAAIGQGRSGKVTGLRTLRLKETDRVAALVESIEKLGGETTSTGGALYWTVDNLNFDNAQFDVFDDHRMAMALAPVAFLNPIEINDPSVVEKSFPNFWGEMAKLGLRSQV